MAPTLATRWFIHAKTLEFDERLQQFYLLAIHHLSDWVNLEAKMVTYFIGQATHYLTFIGILENTLQTPLDGLQ